jgi:hypothetical protein
VDFTVYTRPVLLRNGGGLHWTTNGLFSLCGQIEPGGARESRTIFTTPAGPWENIG